MIEIFIASDLHPKDKLKKILRLLFREGRILLLALLLPTLATAQTCLCCKKRDSGQAAYNKGDYKTALARWQEGTKLSDAAQCPDLPGLLKKAQDKANLAAKAQRAKEAAARAADDGYWEALKDGDIADCDKYLRKYPSGGHASEAHRRKESLAPKPNKTTTAPEGFVFVPGGTYTMGDLFREDDTDETQHSVTVSDFYLGKYEVTVAEFKTFIDATGHQTDAEKADGSLIWNGTEWKRTAGINWQHDVSGNLRPASEHNHPVIHVSWNDATAYCEWLSKKSSKKYRLPTEAEWEYAAREGGKKVRFGNGKDIANPAQINFDGSATYKKYYSVAGEYRQKTVAVGSLNSPNALGIHDMSGNVWEWCGDWYAAYPSSVQTDPTGPTDGETRVLRGGGGGITALFIRASGRGSNLPQKQDGDTSFRIAAPF